MVGQFLAGVIVGVLVGLALAPLLRSWILWQVAKPWRTDAEASTFRSKSIAQGEPRNAARR